MVFLDERQREVDFPLELKNPPSRMKIGFPPPPEPPDGVAQGPRTTPSAWSRAARRAGRPAAPSRNAPVQIDPKRRVWGAATRNQSVISWVIQLRGLPPPETINLLPYCARSPIAQVGMKPTPALVVTGPAVGATVTTS